MVSSIYQILESNCTVEKVRFKLNKLITWIKSIYCLLKFEKIKAKCFFINSFFHPLCYDLTVVKENFACDPCKKIYLSIREVCQNIRHFNTLKHNVRWSAVHWFQQRWLLIIEKAWILFIHEVYPSLIRISWH